MRRPRPVLCLILVLAAALGAGCGGDEEDKAAHKPQLSRAGDSKGAEEAVRAYLRALVAGDGAKACEQLTPEYQRSVVKQNEKFAERVDAGDCKSLVNAITAQSPHTTFEGQPLNEGTVDKIKLRVTVRMSGDEQNATVSGTRGVQRYELETRAGTWRITGVEETGG